MFEFLWEHSSASVFHRCQVQTIPRKSAETTQSGLFNRSGSNLAAMPKEAPQEDNPAPLSTSTGHVKATHAHNYEFL